jgi:phage tail sheath gpL-like
MTIGETATLASFDGSAYSVSDSGSALSVTSASISGLVITLNLSRAIPAGATVTFAYSTSGIPVAGRWSDAAGNQLNNVTSRTITNNSNLQISVGLTVADAISKNTPITISASAAVAGLVTFTIAGKRIPGCFNKSATGSTPIAVTCTFKPALSGWQKITVTLVPTLSVYPTTLTTVDRFIAKRTNRR